MSDTEEIYPIEYCTKRGYYFIHREYYTPADEYDGVEIYTTKDPGYEEPIDSSEELTGEMDEKFLDCIKDAAAVTGTCSHFYFVKWDLKIQEFFRKFHMLSVIIANLRGFLQRM